jgi:hypothetical protein
MRKLVYYLFGAIVIVLIVRTANYAALVPQQSFASYTPQFSWDLPDFNYSFANTFNDISEFSQSLTEDALVDSQNAFLQTLSEISEYSQSLSDAAFSTAQENERLYNEEAELDSPQVEEDMIDQEKIVPKKTNEVVSVASIPVPSSIGVVESRPMMKTVSTTHSQVMARAVNTQETSETELDESDHLESWRRNKFYACFNSGESYGAAWFATRASIFQRKVSTGHREHMETAGSVREETAHVYTHHMLFYVCIHIQYSMFH